LVNEISTFYLIDSFPHEPFVALLVAIGLLRQVYFINLCAACYSTIAAGSRLQFAKDNLHTAVIPATVREIDPSAFERKVWPLVTFDGPPPLLTNGGFLCSPDSRILLTALSDAATSAIPAAIEVIGPRAFAELWSIAEIVFETGTKLREIGENVFSQCCSLKAFVVPFHFGVVN
jgi:hypothetical protein